MYTLLRYGCLFYSHTKHGTIFHSLSPSSPVCELNISARAFRQHDTRNHYKRADRLLWSKHDMLRLSIGTGSFFYSKCKLLTQLFDYQNHSKFNCIVIGYQQESNHHCF